MSDTQIVINIILISTLIGLIVLEVFDTIMDKIDEREIRKQLED